MIILQLIKENIILNYTIFQLKKTTKIFLGLLHKTYFAVFYVSVNFDRLFTLNYERLRPT